MRVASSACAVVMFAATSGANAGIETVERQFIITGQLNLNVVPPGGGPELTTFAVLLGDDHSEQTCQIRRGTDPLHQEWDMTINDYLTTINPLYEGGSQGENPLYESPGLHVYLSPLDGRYETDAAGRTTSYMRGMFTLEWIGDQESVSAVGVSDYAWSWLATRPFGDESFTAVLGSPISMTWAGAELGSTLPSITIMEGSTLTFTLVPGPGAGVLLMGAGVSAVRRRR